MEIYKNRYLTSMLIFFSILLDVIGLSISYITGVSHGTIPSYPYFPFVSDLGEQLPNSSWFTLFLSSSIPFMFFTIERRFAQIDRRHKFGRLNNSAYYFGIISMFGKLIVVSFQMNSSKMIHYGGASIYFVFSLLYIILQTIMTYKAREDRVLTAIRAILCFGMACCMLVFLPFATIPPLSVYNRYSMNVAQGAEWVLVIIQSIFMLTFIYDFWGVVILRKIVIQEAPDEGIDETDFLSPLIPKSRYGNYM